MGSKFVTLCGLIAVSAGSMFADFSYHESSKITGGVLAGMMKVAGVFSKTAREPIESNVAIKGNKLVSRSTTHLSLIDLDSKGTTELADPRGAYDVSVVAFVSKSKVAWRGSLGVVTVFDLNSKKQVFTTQDVFNGELSRFEVDAQGFAFLDLAGSHQVYVAPLDLQRKMLRGSLSGLFPDPVPVLEGLGLSPTARAEELSVPDFVRLAGHLTSE